MSRFCSWIRFLRFLPLFMSSKFCFKTLNYLLPTIFARETMTTTLALPNILFCRLMLNRPQGTPLFLGEWDDNLKTSTQFIVNSSNCLHMSRQKDEKPHTMQRNLNVIRTRVRFQPSYLICIVMIHFKRYMSIVITIELGHQLFLDHLG